jgi:arsenate reductase (glutaredoxin)
LSFVDLAKRPIAAGELRRFTDRLGAAALADTTSRAYRDAGLAWLTLDEEQWLARLLDQPQLLRLPLVRAGGRLAVGIDEDGWRRILADG